MIELDLLGASLEPGTDLQLRVINTGTLSGIHAGKGGNPSTTADLSNLGRFLSHIATSRSDTETATPMATAPVSASPDTEIAFGNALQRSITSSGLFYESHLKDWVNNQRAINDIRLEPQARLVGSGEYLGASASSAQGVGKRFCYSDECIAYCGNIN